MSRRVIGAAVVVSVVLLMAAWLLPRLNASYAAWVAAPAVVAKTIDLDGGALGVVARTDKSASRSQRLVPGVLATAATPDPVTIDPGMAFTMIAVQCRPPDGFPEVGMRVRTSMDGDSWSAWYVTAIEYAAEGSGPARAFTEPLWTGPARYVQVTAVALGDGHEAVTQLEAVHVTVLDTAGVSMSPVAGTVSSALRAAGSFVAGLGLTEESLAWTAKPKIVTRSQWGANESWRGSAPAYAPVKMAFVHHTASGNKYTRNDTPGIVRGIYYYHTKTLGWSDIGYNFLVDRYGRIYEGRYGGVTKGVIGAQTLGFNTGSTGVSVIGDYTSAKPTSAARSALVSLLAWKLDVHHVDPTAFTRITCNYGEKYATGQLVKLRTVSGHRDANYTSCPGSALYAQLPAIRRAVATTGLPKIYDVALSRALISPNGDGSRDKTNLTFRLSSAGNWRITVSDKSGRSVDAFGGRGTRVTTEWGGTSSDDTALEDGTYTLTLAAATARGAARPAAIQVVLDTVPPALKQATVSPEAFSPNGDGRDDEVTLSYTASEASSARISLLDADKRLVQRLSGWSAVSGDAAAVTWDGMLASGDKVAPAGDGRYYLQIALRDRAGNVATFTRPVMIDTTLAFSGVAPATFSPNDDGVRDTTSITFALSRAADITIEVVKEGSVVGSADAGRLGAGTHLWTWDGRDGNGALVASGKYGLRVTAVSSLSTSSIGATTIVDLVPPRLSVASSASVKLGKTAKLKYTVRDEFSAKVKVWADITDANGVAIASVTCGWVKQNTAQTCEWKPVTKGAYVITLHALDSGRNSEAQARSITLTVT